MDNIQAYITSNLPPSVLAHVTEHSSTYWKYYQSFLAARNTVYTYTYPVLSPIFDIVTDFRDHANFTTFILLVILLLLTLQVLNMLRAAIRFWFRIAYNLILWGGIAAMGLWVYTRGIEGSIDDVQVGVQWVIDYWNDSYQGYKHQEELARAAQKITGKRAGGSGWFGR